MSGSLARFSAGGSLELKDKDAAKALRRSSDDGQTGAGGDMDYLSFSGKKGTYALGRDKDDVDPETIFIVEPLAAVEGWTCWKAGKPAKKHEWSIYDTSKAIAAADLEDLGPYNEKVGEGWQQMMGIGLLSSEAPDRSILFTLTSVSGRNVFADLQNEIADQMENGDPYIPLVRLDVEEFTAHGQTNSKPVIDIVAWVSRDEVAAFLADEEGDIEALVDGSYESGDADADADEQEEAEAEQEEQPKRKRARRRKAA